MMMSAVVAVDYAADTLVSFAPLMQQTMAVVVAKERDVNCNVADLTVCPFPT